MKTAMKWTLIVGLVVASTLAGFSQNTVAASSATNQAITIHVRNYAGVAPQTLKEAENVVTGIFRKAGVEAGWADIVLTAENSHVNSTDRQAYNLADIQLSIFPDDMSDRSGLPDNVMGLAPGIGPDRGIVYVFDNKVRTLFYRMLDAHIRGDMDRHVSMGQVLGHAIAHELGHVLLNQQVHSAHGIMRGEWGLIDLRDAADGLLLFTPQQAGVLQADVRRRSRQQETLEGN
jgi:hypothetical protein